MSFVECAGETGVRVYIKSSRDRAPAHVVYIVFLSAPTAALALALAVVVVVVDLETTRPLDSPT